jgi:hypothetical protein
MSPKKIPTRKKAIQQSEIFFFFCSNLTQPISHVRLSPCDFVPKQQQQQQKK